jgi:HD-GYP domain-containing protein (c-di-GMP phosphodiesterase class II)
MQPAFGTRPACSSERRRRAEAIREQRRDATAVEVANAGVATLLHSELQTATSLTVRLSENHDPSEIPQIVVDALHETFAFFLVGVLRLDGDVLRTAAIGNRLGEVMTKLDHREQSVEHGICGRAARTGQTVLVRDTAQDPDYLSRDPLSDPRSALSVPIFCDGRVWGALTVHEVESDALTETHALFLEGIAATLGSALRRAQLVRELRESFTTMLAVLTSTVEAKDCMTATHAVDVSELAERVACRFALERRAIDDVRLAAMLHDIGKVAIPSEILLKPGALSGAEWETMRTHAAIGAELVARIEAFAHLAPLIRHHHERIDGRGYPDGLRGEEIPIGARIIAACDSFDAMTTNRTYRHARALDEAVFELLSVAGSQLDHAVVHAVIAELDDQYPGIAPDALAA